MAPWPPTTRLEARVHGGRMRARCRILATALILSAPVSLIAQDRTVRGTVVDSATGSPLVGANIVVRGTTLGTVTGTDGRFTLANVPARDVNILVRKFGYRFRQITVSPTETEI